MLERALICWKREGDLYKILSASNYAWEGNACSSAYKQGGVHIKVVQ